MSKKLISLKHYIKDLKSARQIFGLTFYIPEEILQSNLTVREMHITNICYNDQWQIVSGNLEMFVEPIDENLPIPQIEQ